MTNGEPLAYTTGDMSFTRTATAVWFPRAREVELREEALPDLADDAIRVRAVASGLSHGTEMLVYRGQVPQGTALDLPTLRGSFEFPIKYGYASVGRVLEVGAAVTRLAEGDLVFALHPHQTEYIVPASLAAPLPVGLPPELGVFTANLETALNILLDAHPRLGERVVVFGEGVVGLLVTQLLRRAGAGLVVAIDPLPLRRELARVGGADRSLPADADVPKIVRELTDGAGADIVIEASGNPAALNQAIDCAAFQGTVVVSSWYGTKPATLALGGAFHRGRLRIISSQVGAIDPALQPRWSHARRLGVVRELLPQLELAPLITQRIPFERAAEAYALVDEHPERAVQVVLTYA
jgi:2-desacetyl-2-hydroxyethyl bacteriochlorophyllide A dehydrogenase